MSEIILLEWIPVWEDINGVFNHASDDFQSDRTGSDSPVDEEVHSLKDHSYLENSAFEHIEDGCFHGNSLLVQWRLIELTHTCGGVAGVLRLRRQVLAQQ